MIMVRVGSSMSCSPSICSRAQLLILSQRLCWASLKASASAVETGNGKQQCAQSNLYFHYNFPSFVGLLIASARNPGQRRLRALQFLLVISKLFALTFHDVIGCIGYELFIPQLAFEPLHLSIEFFDLTLKA